MLLQYQISYDIISCVAGVAQLVEQLIRNQQVMGSSPITSSKKPNALGRHSKGQFSRIRYISKEVCRIFVFVDTNAVLVRKNDKS